MSVRILMFVFISLASAINFRRVAEFPNGHSWRALGFDTDQDGRQNIVFSAYQGPLQFWEHVGYDKYILEDTVRPKVKLYDIGYLDADSLLDMVGNRNGWPYPLYVYESPTPYSNPTSIVWENESLFANICGSYITDLDQDGLHEILFRYTDPYTFMWHTCVYENTGDNEYTLVWQDTIRESSFFVNGDFDQDGLIEFISGNAYGHVLVWECIGENNYEFIFSDTMPNGNSYDIISAHDMDGNGRSEFLFSSIFQGARLYCYETVGDNDYDYFVVDSGLPGGIPSGVSCCGDIDADGIEEIVWSTCNQWHIVKATGIHQYERIYSRDWTVYQELEMNVYDLNANGYPEIIEAYFRNVIPPIHGITLWEIEGVRLHRPNGGEVLNPGDTCLIRWEKFFPPGADSFTLFFSYDSGRTYDTIVSSIASSDTSYPWIVPDIISDSCLIMIWAYGPPRPGEQAPRGTAWDFSDSVFAIRPLGIQEGKVTRAKLHCEVFPNPFTDQSTIQYSLSRSSNVRLDLYDAIGRLVKVLVNDYIETGKYQLIIKRNNLLRGIYFLRLTTGTESTIQKIIILKK